jgi:hypothetical protein
LTIFDFMPDELFGRVRNSGDFLGIFGLDKWMCQTDQRQAIFVPQSNAGTEGGSGKTYQAMMVDQGDCFNGGNWDFPDAPLRGLYFNKLVYRSVVGMESFEPWLDRLENDLSPDVLLAEAAKVPSEWYAGDDSSWNHLLERLDARRTRVRELIWSARTTAPEVFPNWNTLIFPKSIARAIPTTNKVA